MLKHPVYPCAFNKIRIRGGGGKGALERENVEAGNGRKEETGWVNGWSLSENVG